MISMYLSYQGTRNATRSPMHSSFTLRLDDGAIFSLLSSFVPSVANLHVYWRSMSSTIPAAADVSSDPLDGEFDQVLRILRIDHLRHDEELSEQELFISSLNMIGVCLMTSGCKYHPAIVKLSTWADLCCEMMAQASQYLRQGRFFIPQLLNTVPRGCYSSKPSLSPPDPPCALTVVSFGTFPRLTAALTSINKDKNEICWFEDDVV